MKPSLIVVDACVWGAAFFPETFSGHALPLLQAVRDLEVQALMPAVGLAEFLNIVRRKKQLTGMPNIEADQVIHDFLELPIHFEIGDMFETGRRVWSLHTGHGFQTNDAFYFALAEQWTAPICTLDQGFFHAIQDFSSRTASKPVQGFDLTTAPYPAE